ncbi:hypothetical protein GCM10010833_00930 [Blastomonas aquatica]|uniref:Uncharacterized protein n=1 Tax=Blastomonas aquatica TaxID=1510276 RepID=A0ABQ1ITB9_9SPHN|nr:hypothetical protein GCM10010833_00930 [Blastomonas aquatica]
MLRQFVATFASFGVVVAASSATAQTADDAPRDEFILNAWSNPADCNLTVAKRVSFSVLATDAEGMLGECVAVEGHWSGRALFGSIREARTRLSNTTTRLRGKRIGIYAQWESIGEPPDRPTRTMLVGRVGQCETQWPGAMMVMGYCHYTGGPILLVAEAFPS